MSNKYFTGRLDRYIFCDICGQACYVHQAVKLGPHTGRGGLIVCQNDADKIDHGLISYSVAKEQPVKWTRINHQNVENGTEPEDIESSNNLGV